MLTIQIGAPFEDAKEGGYSSDWARATRPLADRVRASAGILASGSAERGLTGRVLPGRIAQTEALSFRRKCSQDCPNLLLVDALDLGRRSLHGAFSDTMTLAFMVPKTDQMTAAITATPSRCFFKLSPPSVFKSYFACSRLQVSDENTNDASVQEIVP